MFRLECLALLKRPQTEYSYVTNSFINSGMTVPHVNSQAPVMFRNGWILLYMILLSLQFGLQPILAKRYTAHGVCKSSVAVMQEVVKFTLAFFMLYISDGLRSQISGWSILSCISDAFLPAGLFCVQNLAILLAYQNLDSLTFNILNQTKTLSAAFCCYVLLGSKQSLLQIISLFLLLASALVIEKVIPIDFLLHGNFRHSEITYSSRHVTHGVLPVLLASFLSGLAGAITEKNLKSSSGNKRSKGRNSYLFSMELCFASLICLVLSLLFSDDGRKIFKNGFFYRWELTTMIPITTNAIGGIVVGLVTKYAGSVRKGFALILGLLISGVVQASLGTDSLSMQHFLGGILAILSLWLHMTHPYISDSTAIKSTELERNTIKMD